MARIWVKGYTKADGTKVPGHYREMQPRAFVGRKRSGATLKKTNELGRTAFEIGGDKRLLRLNTARLRAGRKRKFVLGMKG